MFCFTYEKTFLQSSCKKNSVGHLDFFQSCLKFEFSPPLHFNLISNPLDPLISSLMACICCKHLGIFVFISDKNPYLMHENVNRC